MAKVIAISGVVAVFAWKLGGHEVYDNAVAGTALTEDENTTWQFFIALLVIPGVLGFVAGEIVDQAARRISDAQERRRPSGSEAEPPNGLATRTWNGMLETISARLLPDGPTTWDRTWRHLQRTQAYVYVRVTTKNGREIVGTIADRSRIALSPQARDLYIEQALLPTPDGRYYPTTHGLGAFVSGSELESVEWVSAEGMTRSDQDDA